MVTLKYSILGKFTHFARIVLGSELFVVMKGDIYVERIIFEGLNKTLLLKNKY